MKKMKKRMTNLMLKLMISVLISTSIISNVMPIYAQAESLSEIHSVEISDMSTDDVTADGTATAIVTETEDTEEAVNDELLTPKNEEESTEVENEIESSEVERAEGVIDNAEETVGGNDILSGDLEIEEEVLPMEDVLVNVDLLTEETTAKYNSYLKFPDNNDKFYGGEIITIYNGVTISGNFANIESGSHTFIYLNKDSFEKPLERDISTNFEKIASIEITEDDENYIIRTNYTNLYGGYDGATPIKVALKRRMTINETLHNIKQEYYTADGIKRAESELNVTGKAKLETAGSNNYSPETLRDRANENSIIKENTFIDFYPSSIYWPNANESDPRDRRIYATVPDDIKVKEDSGWAYDENLKKWYKDVSRDELYNNYKLAALTIDMSGMDFSEYDSKEKAKDILISFSAQAVVNSTPQNDLAPYTWTVKRSFYVPKVVEVVEAYMYVSTYRKAFYMNENYGPLYGNRYDSSNVISIPHDKSLLGKGRIFFDHQVIGYYSINNDKGDSEDRKLIIKSAETDVPTYSYPSQIRINIVGNEEIVNFYRDKLQGTKVYGVKFDGTKELITDNVPIINSTVNDSVRAGDWHEIQEADYKSVFFEFPEEGIVLHGENEIRKYYSAIHTNVVVDLRERILDDLKTLMDQNKEPYIYGRGSNIAGYPTYDDYSRVVVSEVLKKKETDENLSTRDITAGSDTDTYYSLQYEYIYANNNINITNGSSFFVEDTVSTSLSYIHVRKGNFSDATTPENLNVYYLVPDGLEPIENPEMYTNIDIIRGYRDGYNLIVAKPKTIKIPSIKSNDLSISGSEGNYYTLDFKATKRLDIGDYTIYAAMSIDNNKIDIKNGRQYGILQSNTPDGVFSELTKTAMNRPEDPNKYTSFSSKKFTIYPPQTLVALKDVKMSYEENNKYSSSVGSKATIGDGVDYRLRLKNNGNKPIETLTIIDILPFKGDKAIVENQNGEYLSRGSKFSTPLLNIDENEKFDIYYSTDVVKDTIEENKNASWSKNIDDMSKVTMFKAVLKSGKSIGVNEVCDIVTHNIIDEDQTINDGEKAFNSYAISLNNDASFIETMKTEVQVNYDKNDVIIEKVDADDEDVKLEGVTFDLYSSDDQLIKSGIVTNRNGIAVIPNLLVGKKYYLIETSTLDGYKLIEDKIHFDVYNNIHDNAPEMRLAYTPEEVILVIKNSKDTVSIPVEKRWVKDDDTSSSPVNIILLADGEERERATLSAENEWKHTFTGLARKNLETNQVINYTVIEEGTDSNNEITIEEKTYNVNISGDMENGYIIVNTAKKVVNGGGDPNPLNREDEGNILISKKVNGIAIDKNKEFTFTITLDKKDVSGTYGDITFNNGVAGFTLKHSEEKLATNLPAGVSYTVIESNNEGYEVTSTNDKGTIEKDKTAVVSFINNKINTDIPEKPIEPKQPETPDKPTEPSRPGRPSKPTKPVDPTKPIDPTKPDEPVVPEVPVDNIVVDNKEISFGLIAIKKLNGGTLKDDMFKFALKNENNDIMQIKSNKGDKVTFDLLTYQESGKYIYFISEIAGEDKDIIYDNATYKVIVDIEKTEETYTAKIKYEKDGKTYEGTPVFNNIKQKAETPKVNNKNLDHIPKTGDTTNLIIYGFSAIISAIFLFVIVRLLRKENHKF